MHPYWLSGSMSGSRRIEADGSAEVSRSREVSALTLSGK